MSRLLKYASEVSALPFLNLARGNAGNSRQQCNEGFHAQSLGYRLDMHGILYSIGRSSTAGGCCFVANIP